MSGYIIYNDCICEGHRNMYMEYAYMVKRAEGQFAWF